MITPGIFAPRWKAQFEAWASDKRGIAALEFALIAVPFFFLIFGLLEVSVLFIMSSILEHGVGEAARQIRTGELQNAGTSMDGFRTQVCEEMFEMLFDCETNLQLDVQVFDNFTAADAPDVIDSDGNLDADDFGFDAGAREEIVVVRVFYEWNLMTPVLSAPLANMSNGRRLLQSTVAFRNEPF